MNQVIKFPDMRPPRPQGAPAAKLPPPSQYRLMSPAILTTEALNATKPRGRRRLFLLFGVAVALHAAVFLAIWLSPPLRLKWGPSPDAWVQVVSLPAPKAPAPAVTAVGPATAAAKSNTGKPNSPKPDAAKQNTGTPIASQPTAGTPNDGTPSAARPSAARPDATKVGKDGPKL